MNGCREFLQPFAILLRNFFLNPHNHMYPELLVIYVHKAYAPPIHRFSFYVYAKGRGECGLGVIYLKKACYADKF